MSGVVGEDVRGPGGRGGWRPRRNWTLLVLPDARVTGVAPAFGGGVLGAAGAVQDGAELGKELGVADVGRRRGAGPASGPLGCVASRAGR